MIAPRSVNQYNTLEEAFGFGQAMLDQYCDSAGEEHKWGSGAFGIKIIDTLGRVYFESVPSGYCDVETYNYREMCHDCPNKSPENCVPDCPDLPQKPEKCMIIVDNAKFIQCYKFLTFERVIYLLLNNPTFTKNLKAAFIKVIEKK